MQPKHPNDCPSQDELSALLSGSLDDQREQTIELHVATCQDCEATLEELCHNKDADRWQYLAGQPQQQGTLDSRPAADQPASHRPFAKEHELAPTISGYEILEVAGRGGMGVVYRAQQFSLNRVVAIKTLHSSSPDDATRIQRFKNEADSIASIQHPNVVAVYEIGEHEGIPFIVLEYVDGPNLSQLIKQSAPFDNFSAAQLVQKIALAVHAAHQQNLIHRDLKPANVMMQTSADMPSTTFELKDYVPKITDFGLAKSFEYDNKTQTSLLVGTPSYMAPEQITCPPGWAKPAVDIYALGVILYQLLTGRLPFEAKSTFQLFKQIETNEPVPPSSYNRRVARDLEAICFKCLEKSPEHRYSSTRDLAEDLDRFLRQKPVVARTASTFGRLKKWALRNKPLVALGLVALAATLFLGSLLVNVYRQRQAAVKTFYKRVQQGREYFVQAKSSALLEMDDWESAEQEIRSALDIQDEFNNLVDDTEIQQLYDAIEFHHGTRRWFRHVDEWILDREIKALQKFAIAESSEKLKSIFKNHQPIVPGDPLEFAKEKFEQLDDKSREAFLTTIYRGLLTLQDWEDEEWYRQLAESLDSSQWRKDALAAVSGKDPEAAARLLETPDLIVSADSLSDFGNAFFHQNIDPRVMVEYLKKCHLKNPSSFWLNLRLANTIRSYDFATNAIAYMRAAVAQRESFDVRLQLAALFEQMRDFNTAGQEYVSILERHPKWGAMVISRIANISRQQGNFDEAIKDYQTILQMPEVPEFTQANLLATYAQAQQIESGQEFASQLVTQKSPEEVSYHSRALAHASLGQLEEAVVSMQQAVDADKRCLRCRFDLAGLYRKQGNLKLARTELEEIQKLVPNDLAVLQELIDVCAEQNDFDSAIEFAQNNIALFKREPRYFADLARVYEQASKPDLAEANFNTCAVRLGQLAILYNSQRKYELAESVARQAIAVRPSADQANFMLIQLLCNLGRLDEALEQSYEYQRQAPQSIYSHASVLNTLVVMKRYDEAIEAFETGKKFDSDPPRVFTAGQLDRLKKLSSQQADD